MLFFIVNNPLKHNFNTILISRSHGLLRSDGTILITSICLLIVNIGYCKKKYGVIKEISKDAEGEIIQEIEYELDYKGRKIRGIDSYIGRTDEIRYKYDYKGNLISEIWHNEYLGDNKGKDYQYNDEGFIIKKTEYLMSLSGEKSTIRIDEYAYDKKGNVTVEITEIGDLKTIIEYQYNIKGKKFEPFSDNRLLFIMFFTFLSSYCRSTYNRRYKGKIYISPKSNRVYHFPYY